MKLGRQPEVQTRVVQNLKVNFFPKKTLFYVAPFSIGGRPFLLYSDL